MKAINEMKTTIDLMHLSVFYFPKVNQNRQGMTPGGNRITLHRNNTGNNHPHMELLVPSFDRDRQLCMKATYVPYNAAVPVHGRRYSYEQLLSHVRVHLEVQDRARNEINYGYDHGHEHYFNYFRNRQQNMENQLTQSQRADVYYIASEVYNPKNRW